MLAIVICFPAGAFWTMFRILGGILAKSIRICSAEAASCAGAWGRIIGIRVGIGIDGAMGWVTGADMAPVAAGAEVGRLLRNNDARSVFCELPLLDPVPNIAKSYLPRSEPKPPRMLPMPTGWRDVAT